MMIAENILRTMDLTKVRSMGKKAATTTLLGCPLPTGPASHLGEHNKCNNDDQTINDGKFKVSDADKVIKEYCLKHQGNTVRSGPDGILEKYQNGDDKGSSLALMASLNVEPACQDYPNKGKLNFFDCSSNFGSAMNDCDTNTVDEKYGGVKTADCISYTIHAIKETTSSDSPKPNPERTCSLHLAQRSSYRDESGNDVFANPDAPVDYTVEVTIYDGTGNDKKQIGHSDEKEAGDGNPLKVKTDGVEGELEITPEKQNDYVQFTLGGQSWKSSDKGSCGVGGWDPRESIPSVSFLCVCHAPFCFVPVIPCELSADLIRLS
ncbi:MAG: hypothetical protein Q9204_006399 [Flavoplaca sp. TL-2023a]